MPEGVELPSDKSESYSAITNYNTNSPVGRNQILLNISALDRVLEGPDHGFIQAYAGHFVP